MINGSVKPPTELMSEKETIEAFCDGAKRASMAAKELAKELDSIEWSNIVSTLEAMAIGGRQLYEAKSMSRFETLMAANMKAAPYNPN